ncbi:DsbA family protein [Trueperella bialowiezensis]|uniref:Protein-disulfide isomerase n=1 Tax=Trueperella bialowiezensis TaxID=312285 RepID=A0A3S4X5H7_9ACTO|nr:thioredoxin domain-containing protein [Trueperella bialowiezensis]VEI13106.1 Protein-disulfide isomerase [Trueperella bialowiezensis]
MANNRKPKGRPATKEEKRQMAREKARILREQEEKRKKRNRFLAIAGGVVVLALVVFAVLQILGKDSGGQEYEGTARPAELANVADDYGINIGASGAAGETVADAGVLSVFSDYTCSGCINLENKYSQQYRTLMNEGKLSLRLYPVATLGNHISDNMTAAMYYVATYAPAQALDFNEALFAETNGVVFGGNRGPDAKGIADIAAKVGVPADVVADMPASITSEAWQKVAVDATESFRAKGHQYTPTLEVNGVADNSWAEEGGSVDAVIQRVVDEGAPGK